jgi:signal transduction histidine kinase
VQVELTLSPGLAVVQVRDWGKGIPAAELPNIFDRFHRAESAGGHGHGLGLYIASALARLHGGTLGAHSTLGEGSTFSLRLPLPG